MRAIVLGFVIAVALAATAFSQDYSPLNKGDFRNATWGMTKEEVRQSEQYNSYISKEGIDDNGEDGISYLGEWAGFEVFLRYVFVDDAFDHGICLFTLLNQDDLNNWFDNFVYIRDKLSGQYFSPTSDEWVWNENIPEAERVDMHDALQKGDLKREAIWNTATSTITLNLVTSNDQMRLALICRDARNFQTAETAAASQQETQYAISQTGVDTNTNPNHSLLNCYDFRCLAWGDAKDDVGIMEFAEPDTFQQNLSDDIYGPIALWYDDNIAGYDAQISYFFNNDSLYRGFYEFILPNPNDSLVLADFDSIKQALNRDFWPAEYDQIVWTDSLLQENSMDWLDALKQGGAKRVATWYTTRSNISLILSAENSKFILDLYYDDASSSGY